MIHPGGPCFLPQEAGPQKETLGAGAGIVTEEQFLVLCE
jgi:hypothetical protein